MTGPDGFSLNNMAASVSEDTLSQVVPFELSGEEDPLGASVLSFFFHIYIKVIIHFKYPFYVLR